MIADALDVVAGLPMELSDLTASPSSESGMDEGAAENNNNNHSSGDDMTKGESDAEMNGYEDEYLPLADITLDVVLPDAAVPFSFKVPSAVPPYLNAHYTCETGSRLLFSSILWLGKLPVFQQLSKDLQSALIKATWTDIFILNFVQMSSQISFNAVMTSIAEYFKSVVAQEQTSMDKLLVLSDNVCLFNEFVRETERLQLDDLCFAALRVIILFGARGVRRDYPGSAAQMDKIVDVASNELRRQLCRNSPEGGEERATEEQFVRVIMKITTLSKFDAQVVEQFFFARMVGQVNVENVIPYILKLGNSSNISVGDDEEYVIGFASIMFPIVAGKNGAGTIDKESLLDDTIIRDGAATFKLLLLFLFT